MINAIVILLTILTIGYLLYSKMDGFWYFGTSTFIYSVTIFRHRMVDGYDRHIPGGYFGHTGLFRSASPQR